MAVPGWWFAEISPWARSAAAVEHAVGRIAGGRAVEFVSPVFLDDRREPVVITPDLLVGLDRDLDPSRAEEILVRSGAGKITDRGWANMKRASLRYPASLPSVNAVAAPEPCGGRAPFSNYGAGLAFAAPGHYGISTDRTGTDGFNDGVADGGCLPSGTLRCGTDDDCPPGETCFLVTEDYVLIAGTSIASPCAAGVAALVLSVNRNLTADQVESVLQQSAVDLGDPRYDTVYGWGMVNAYNAVQLAVAISGTPGEATDLRVTAFDPTSGNLDLSYLPGCASSSHDIYYGSLDDVASYGWSGSTCGIGNTGRYAGFHPGSDSYFFVLVGNAGDDEGPYGPGDLGAERPAAGPPWCARTQQLDTACTGG